MKNQAKMTNWSWRGCIPVTVGMVVVAIGSAWIGIFGNPLDATRLRLFKTCPGCRFEFSNAHFRDADLAEADLSGVNLYGRDFSRANLQQSKLDLISSPPGSPAIFQGANLSQATMRHANLPNSDFTKARLEKVNLQHSDLIYVNLTGASLKQANLTEARLTGAKLLNTDFQGANLTKAKMCFLPTLPNLEGAILNGALITGADAGFTLAQKQALQKRGAIVGGPSENCYR